MRANGITYDTGFVNAGMITHDPFDREVVKREMQIIREDLHCTAVRVTGGDLDRLEIAATHAADVGLEVWYSPFTCDLTTDELLIFLTDCAHRAERLRRQGAEVVLLTGAELSMFTVGFLPGETITERSAILATPERLGAAMAGVPARLNDFLGQAVRAVRERFGGKVSYAAIPSFEGVDWTPFDFVSYDLYRSIEYADTFPAAVRGLVAGGKPVAVTEFGCCTYRGAADRGAHGVMIVEWEGPIAARLDGDYLRDEAEQATYMCELLDIFNAEGVDSAFMNTFACYHLPHREGPRADLDLASSGVVMVFEDRLGETYPDMAWEPKAAFAALADYYRR
ncbi:hypothetical protein BC739_008044 [Kutzneria viridogrisea]|uniref:Abortive infection protein n=1 Tax=Kutzneria viridogrisea TaxID=47990 RepID=A0ABR6BV74_9PSEU|nr:hypothetical protein [Kutzneria viridogrisea]